VEGDDQIICWDPAHLKDNSALFIVV